MQRKLIQLSPSTAVVSLPSRWIRNNHLKKGDPIYLEENENSILVSAKGRKAASEITIDLSKLQGRLLWAAVDAAYISGYETISLLTHDDEQKKIINKMVRFMPGMIIEEERKGIVRFKDISAEGNLDIGKIVSRIFNMIITIMDETIELIQKKDWPALPEMKKRDYNINSYMSLGLRHMNRFGYSPFSKTGIMHIYLKTLELFSDKLCESVALIGASGSCSGNDIKMLHEIKDLLSEALSIHFSYSQDKLVEYDAKRKKLASGIKDDKYHYSDLFDLLYALAEIEVQLNI
jgi:phosphate uptake regulator